GPGWCRASRGRQAASGLPLDGAGQGWWRPGGGQRARHGADGRVAPAWNARGNRVRVPRVAPVEPRHRGPRAAQRAPGDPVPGAHAIDRNIACVNDDPEFSTPHRGKSSDDPHADRDAPDVAQRLATRGAESRVALTPRASLAYLDRSAPTRPEDRMIRS